MEIGRITPQPNVRPVEMTAQQNKPTNERQREGTHESITQKMKDEPGYIPTLQEKVVIKAIEEANKRVSGGPREFEFAIHEQTKQIMVKVLDMETKEVIREIPPEKILDMIAGMWEAAGLFVDEKR